MMLISIVRFALDPQIFLHATLALKQALRARAWDRIGRQAAMLIELVARLAYPPLTPVHPGDDHLGIEHELHTLRFRVSHLHLRVFSSRTLARELRLGFAQRSRSSLTGPQMLRQLIATRLAIELILGSVDLAGLLQDLAGELLVVEVAVMRRAFAYIFVPSIAITPTFASPACRQSPSTSLNNSARAASWRTRNRAIVA
jgi:hypothetical protein